MLRDKIRALAAVRERHFAEDEARADADYVGVFCDGANACAHVEMVRGGRRIGQRRHFARHAKGATAGEVVAAFVGQRYAEFDPPRWIFVARAARRRMPRAAGRSPGRAPARRRQKARAGRRRQRAPCAFCCAKARQPPAPSLCANWQTRSICPRRPRESNASMSATPRAKRRWPRAFSPSTANRTTPVYRRYKIRAAANDDYAATREAIFSLFRQKTAR